MKRIFDFSAAFVGLTILAPVLAAIALAVWLGDRRWPFYRGVRIGRRGAEFPMIKFRTMVPDAWKSGVFATSSDDSRITRIGKWLRACKLDELPQLWNVLVGEMSLVGPRPQVPSDARLYTAEERRLLEFRPGITDLASIVFSGESSLLREAADPDLLTQQILRPWKSRLALAYRDHAPDLLLDLQILSLTLLSAASARRARAGVAKILTKWHADRMLIGTVCGMASGREAPLAWPPPGASAIVQAYRIESTSKGSTV